MNRLRKKPDAHYSQDSLSSTLDREFSTDTLPQLPTTDDFRTSLILPDLSRRFSLLRSSTSDPAAFDNHLRIRLADQRARGAVNQISEEEEDMLLNALGRLRVRHNVGEKLQEKSNGIAATIDATTGDYGSDEKGPISATLNSSPSSRSGKRYSNSLFTSGRLRDYAHLKSVYSSKSSASSTRTVSLTPTEMSVKKLSTSSMLSNTPERTTPPISVQPSSNAIADTDADEDMLHTDNTLDAVSDAEYQLQDQLGPINLKRASMALQQVMKEIEDELEEEILLPRTTPIPRGNLDLAMQDVRSSQSSRDSSVFEGGMAISIDGTADDNASDRGASPIPARAMPGYVPGMPRPMTPRIVDIDEQRSLSTTPRAQSPTVAVVPINSSKVRRDSTSSITKPLAIAPLFLQRSTNGRFTPTVPSATTADEDGAEYNSPPNSSVFNRRRPASPLAGLVYQPLVSNRPNSRSNSRPSTPSNVVWTPNSSANGHGRRASHSRSNSLTTDPDTDYRGPLGILSKPSGPRALRSPPLPDPETLESEQITKATGSNGKDQPATISNRPHGTATTSPPSSPLPRALTPTQNAPRSPKSPSFGNKSARHNPPPSPFNISAFSGLAARANSSRSSLDSVGSSFHSWDEPDKIISVFSDSKENQVLWHDFVDLDKSSSPSPGDESDAEDVLKRYGGLKKADIAAIQDKLVIATYMKLANTDPRDRAPSALRRRRPSTSQSNYTRIASPPPQTQPPASPTHATSDDQFSKASALLNSVVESIKDQPSTLNVSPIARAPSSSSDEKELSPATRRNRALARALFGEEDSKEGDFEANKAEPIKSITEPESIVSTSSTDTTRVPSTPATSNLASTTSYVASSPPISAQSSMSQTLEPTYLHRNPSVTKVQQTPSEQADLVREVQKKAEAAMIALNKTSSSSVNLPGGLSYSSSIRRRVDPKNISMPKLVSTTNNLDGMSLTKLNNNSTSKLSSRFRRLRGSLRVKNMAPSGEETITPVSPGITSPTQAVPSENSKPAESNTKPPNTPVSSEHSRFKIPLQSPVSSGPGLKGFMARFRNKQRMSETPAQTPAQERPLALPTATAIPMSPRSVNTVTTGLPASPSERINMASRSPGQPRPMYSRFPPATLTVTQAPTSSLQSPKTQLPTESQTPESPSTEQSRAALQLLFSAANDLGLDQNALTDLLSRSGSVSSRTLLNRSNSVAQSTPHPGAAPSNGAEPVSYVSSTGSDQTATPTNYTNLTSQQEKVLVHPVTPDDLTQKPDHLRRPKDGQTENNPVVRITRVYANDTPELAGLINRKSTNRRKRVSTASVSSRSVHDRAPTPPPPKAARRFSADHMPPVPHLPNGLGQGGPPVAASASITNHLQSTYDSVYDMYAGDSRAVSMAVVEDVQLPQEAQPALEVIELANGETVWNVINGLRDDEVSVYSRGSFVSEYSTREGGDVSQIFGKSQSRSDSRISVAPLFSSPPIKGQQLQGKSRPETKVFYSSSEQIGRLIENLSQGADAGSFNFLPSIPSDRPGHSKTSSLSTNDINWTVEERLERMLGAMTAS